MPTKRECRVRLAKQLVVTLAAAKGLYWLAGVDRGLFMVGAGFVLATWRRVMDWASPIDMGYEIHNIDGVERYFCEVCAKEEGDCPRCYETEVRLRSDG